MLGVASGLVGVHLVLRRLAFFAMAMAHATFPGVVLAAWIGVPLLAGSLVFALALLGLLVATSRLAPLDGSTAVGVVLSGSFGLGALLHGMQNGRRIPLANVLVGQIYALEAADLVTTALVAVVVAMFLVVAHRPLVLGAFDPESSRAVGYSRWLDVGVLGAITVVLVTAVPAVGSVLSVALVVVPALTARLWTDRLVATFATSVGVAVVSGLAGLQLSSKFDLAAGACVALTAAALFAFSWLVAPKGVRAVIGSRFRPLCTPKL